jgi:hypothetical protein
MIDLNTLVSNALIAAVQQAIAPLNERIATLELQRGEMQRTIVTYSERISALENNPAQGQDLTPTTGLTRDQVEALIERTMDHHLECYDHDNYDEIASKVDDYDFDDFVTNDRLEDAVREAVGNLSFDISVS